MRIVWVLIAPRLKHNSECFFVMHLWTRVTNPQVFKRGGQVLLRLGDTDVPYSDEFRFFVTTKLANPHYMPEICIKVATRDMLGSWRRFTGHTSTNGYPQLRYVEKNVLHDVYPRVIVSLFPSSAAALCLYVLFTNRKRFRSVDNSGRSSHYSGHRFCCSV